MLDSIVSSTKVTGVIAFEPRTFDDGSVSYKLNSLIPAGIRNGAQQYERVTFAVIERGNGTRAKGDTVSVEGFVRANYYMSKKTGKPVAELRLRVEPKAAK